MNSLLRNHIMDSALKAEDIKNRLYYLKNVGIIPEYLEDVLADLNIEEYELNEYDMNELQDLFSNLFE